MRDIVCLKESEQYGKESANHQWKDNKKKEQCSVYTREELWICECCFLIFRGFAYGR